MLVPVEKNLKKFRFSHFEPNCKSAFIYSTDNLNEEILIGLYEILTDKARYMQLVNYIFTEKSEMRKLGESES